MNIDVVPDGRYPYCEPHGGEGSVSLRFWGRLDCEPHGGEGTSVLLWKNADTTSDWGAGDGDGRGYSTYDGRGIGYSGGCGYDDGTGSDKF